MKLSPALPLLLVSALALPCSGQSVKLNGPLATELSGHFGSPLTSPDGSTLVYVADRDGGPESELYACPADGQGAPRRLTDALVRAGGFQITRDGHAAVFQADVDSNGSTDLAITPLDGSAPPALLGGSLTPGKDVLWFQIGGDGVHALFLADRETDEVVELYSVRLDGSTPPVKLNGPLVAGGDVVDPRQSADGRLVVYRADQETDETMELYMVPTDGGSPAVKLPIPLVAGGDVRLFELDSAGLRVVYSADQEEAERIELFALPADGSAPPTKLSGTLVAGGDVGNFALTSDGQRVVYQADQETDGLDALYGVPTDGSAAAVILSTASDRNLLLARTSPDSAWVLYLSDADGDRQYDLFSAPVDGSAPARRISGPMVPGGGTYFSQFSHDGARVVYEADQETDDVFELFSVPVDGSTAPVRLNGPMVPGGDLSVSRANLLPGFQVMGDGVMYEADQEVDGLNELWFAPLAGGASARKLAAGPVLWAFPSADPEVPYSDFARVLFARGRTLDSIGVAPGASPVLLDEAKSETPVGQVGNFLLSASGDEVVYRAQQQYDLELGELYSVHTDDPRAHVRLRTEADVGHFSAPLFFTRGGEHVIYLTFALNSNAADLLVQPVDASARPVRINASPADIGVDSVVLFADERRLAFVAPIAGTEPRRGVFVAPADGGASPVLLSATLNVLSGLEVSADGSRIAFRSSEIGLYVAPSDAGSPPARVDAGTRPAESYALSPDGMRIVYRTGGSGPREVFGAPTDASEPPVRLNAPLTRGGNVTAFALEPLGRRVVYLADQEIDERFELFSVPADGSEAPRRLHPEFLGNVFDFQISPAGARVVYRANARTPQVPELFGVPIDASAPPVPLHLPLAIGSHVRPNYAISPDGRRVVYRADPIPGEFELFSTSIQGARGQVLLGRAPAAGGSVNSFLIAPDSRSVTFTADRAVIPFPNPHALPNPRTLLVVPIRGTRPAVEVAGPFHGAGSVNDFQISSDSRVVVFQSDQEIEGTLELFAARPFSGLSSRAGASARR